MMAASVDLKDGPLRKLAAEFDLATKSYVKVGVLGASVPRGKGQVAVKRWKSTAKWNAASGKYLNNAEIGTIHEFGSPDAGIPERSFLRMPILSRLSDEMKTVPVKDWEATLFDKGLVGILRAIGQSAVNVVQEAFHSGGFGRWAKLKAATIRRKGSSDVLVDSTQLRRSITFAVITPKSK